MQPSFSQLPPLSLYVHIPWCARKCPYCDFNSHALTGDLPEQLYIQALLADLDDMGHYAQGRPLQSIFFGGGTPSLFSAAGIAAMIAAFAQRLPFVNPIEITRNEYRKIAKEANKPYIEIEIICTDQVEHQKRIDTRTSAIHGLKLPTWKDVLNRDYESWETKSLVLDTAKLTVDEAVEKIITKINSLNL